MLAMTNENNTNVVIDSKFSEDWLPIRAIANGMIQTEDGYYVTGVKITPRNIFILDEGARNNILFNLGTFYNTIEYIQ